MWLYVTKSWSLDQKNADNKSSLAEFREGVRDPWRAYNFERLSGDLVKVAKFSLFPLCLQFWSSAFPYAWSWPDKNNQYQGSQARSRVDSFCLLQLDSPVKSECGKMVSRSMGKKYSPVPDTCTESFLYAGLCAASGNQGRKWRQASIHTVSSQSHNRTMELAECLIW